MHFLKRPPIIINQFQKLYPIQAQHFSQNNKKKGNANNPFMRSMEDFQQKRYGKSASYEDELKYNQNIHKPRFKTKRERQISIARMKTDIRQNIINPIKALATDIDFLVRLAFFLGVLYGIRQMFIKRENLGINLKNYVQLSEDDNKGSGNKFSKTFGQEKKLDEILQKINSGEILENKPEEKAQLTMDDILKEDITQQKQ